eukprot:TRINITY_DN4940_c0_g1_i1.p1 TRINITY_DN4940_c0_g1~~TRINITY_DN4940_c0_g1_i1.p1  ORF type:complete len:82 (+),score=22.64 TRINITY_DN4940_c0_g1_i1:317-562(+)
MTYTAENIAQGGKQTSHKFFTTQGQLRHQLWKTPDLPSFKTGGLKMDYCCTTINENQFPRLVMTLHWPNGRSSETAKAHRG